MVMRFNKAIKGMGFGVGQSGAAPAPLVLPSPVLYYKLDDLTDATGRGNTLTAVGGPSFVAGKLGNGLRSASGKYLKAVSNADNLSGGGSFTVAGWGLLDALAGDYTMMSKWNSGAVNQREWMLAKQNSSGNTFSFWLSSDGGVADYKSVIASHWGPPSTGELHFAIAWYDSATNKMYIQINGGAVNSAVGLTSPPVLQGISEFRIGDAGSVFYWVGVTDEVWKVNALMTRAQRDAIYNANNALAYPWTFTTPAGPLVVFDGDSTTAGGGLTNQYDSYPTVCAKALGRTYCWENSGVNGQTIEQINTDATTLVDPLVNTDVYTANIYVLWAGINNLRYSDTAASAWAKLLTGIQARQTAGWSVVVGTLMPATGAGFAADYETKRLAYNALIVANAATYGYTVADVGADVTMGAAGAQNNPTNFQSDKIHPTAAGDLLIAPIFQTAVLASIANHHP